MKTIFYFIFYSHLFLLHTYSFNSSHTGFIFIPQKWPKGPYLSPCLCFGSSFFLVCPFYFDWHIWFKGLTYRYLLLEACPDSTSGEVTPLTFVCAFSFVWTSVTVNWDVLGIPGSISVFSYSLFLSPCPHLILLISPNLRLWHLGITLSMCMEWRDHSASSHLLNFAWCALQLPCLSQNALWLLEALNVPVLWIPDENRDRAVC